MTEAIEIKLQDITLLKRFMPRDGIDWNVVEEYSANIVDLPPILVAREKSGVTPFILIDGWHRCHAHRAINRDTIMAIVDEELEPKNFLFRAICANKAHGIRFTAKEKVKLSKYLFIRENRSAAEISQAIGCSVRHATDLIKDLAHDKKQKAIRLAKEMSDRGISQRDIADSLTSRGFKASKSGVDRWLKIEEKPVASPQIGESPKRDTTIEEAREIAMELAEPPDEPTPIVTELAPEDFEKLYCAKCKKDSGERKGKWYKITVDTVDSSTVFDFMICSFCRRALGRWVRNE